MSVRYTPKKISEIKSGDSKVSLVGKVEEIGKDSFVLYDESGRREIYYDEKIEPQKIVRVFCSVVQGNLKADVVQVLENFDLNLYKKSKELYMRAGL